jgi:hypothetical protein
MTARRERNAHACQRQSWEQSATHPPHGDAAEHEGARGDAGRQAI